MPGKWIKTTLGNVLTLKRGYDLPEQDRVPGPHPIVSSSGITGRHREAKVRGPGVVTGRYGTLGEVHYIVEDYWPLNTTLFVEDFRGNEPRFIAYFLKCLDFRAFSDKSSVPGLNRNHLHSAVVRFPRDVAEQRAIAAVLGALDDKIELNRRMCWTLEGIARAIFQAWFVDFEPVRAKAAGAKSFRGMPQAVFDTLPTQFVDSPLGPIPKGWAVRPIGEVVDVVGGGTPSTEEPAYWEGGTHAFCTPKDMAGLAAPVLLKTERCLTDAGVARVSSGQLPRGTVLLSSRAPIGYLAIAEIPVSVNQGIIAMRCPREIPNVYVLLWARANMDQIEANANGSTFQEISKRNFRPIPMLVPDSACLSAFGRVTETIYQRIVAGEQQSGSLAALRDALLPKLVSGELRIKDVERIIGRCA